jgi:copper/silver efflux system protein
MLDKILAFCIDNKLVVFLLLAAAIGWGLMVAPFDWDLGPLSRDPIAVDAIPDIGENQQIVFTEWPGRSPQDVEDQITYPMTVALLGIPGVKTIRSFSFFGFSSVYAIFEDDVEFYWSRSRVLEKLNSLPKGTVPEGVKPQLGPDATALGQVYWYTLEGRDSQGNPAGGWDLHELRTIQDWTVRYSLQSADGVSEVASIGGMVKEYQVDVDPDLMRHFGVTLEQVVGAVRMSNLDIGAKTIEINRAEHVVRAVGFIKDVSDIEKAVVLARDNAAVLVSHVAEVSLGPAMRRGALDKEGAEAVGGVVVVRYGENPLSTIKNVKERIKEISGTLPSRTLPDGTVSKVTIVPFYDRSGLINETLATLETALTDEVLVTVVVVVVMVLHLASSVLVSLLLPIAVLLCFVAMKLFGVDANIVALSGIAIAIGTMVDVGIVISENILRHLQEADPEENRRDVVFRAASEVSSAVLTAVATTVVSFLPVFTMEAAEGKLFRPLAYTKTFALMASIAVALTVIPPLAHILMGGRIRKEWLRRLFNGVVAVLGLTLGIVWSWWWPGMALVLWAAYREVEGRLPPKVRRVVALFGSLAIAAFVLVFLARHWSPLGPEAGQWKNLLFAAVLTGGLLLFFYLFQIAYPYVLRWTLRHKVSFLSVPVVLVLLGATIWLGFDKAFFFVEGAKEPQKQVAVQQGAMFDGEWMADARRLFPGLEKQFMPPLDEGAYLLMPTTMPHASIGEALDVLRKQDMAIRAIPEVNSVVGKIGRVESPLDPAPVSMIETVITYLPEYRVEKDGTRVRQWRDHIKEPDDIWAEIQKAGKVPGTTMAPRLQPIAARIVMLQSGMRAPMGVKVKGPDLETIERVGLRVERELKKVKGVKGGAVNADRIVGKPYLEIHPDVEALSRFGIHKKEVMDVIEIAVGGRPVTVTVEGRERYPVRVRYTRELRDSVEALGHILVSAADGTQIPLEQLTDIRYVRGPQAIKSEDTFLVGYVTFDKEKGHGEVDVVERARKHLDAEVNRFGKAHELASAEAARKGRTLTREEIDVLPGLNLEGCSFVFAGNYENQVRSEKTLLVVLPLALLVIFIILYLQFRSVLTTLMVFSGILVAWSGGFILLWLYAQPWFLDFEVFGANLRDLFQVGPVELSVAVWVGFIALFGIATDDGVVIATYLKQSFAARQPESIAAVREAVVFAGSRRVRACLMTTATTLLALLPVLTSTGRGSDIMVPMALPSVGGMGLELLTMFVVPVLYSGVEEWKLRLGRWFS